MYKINLYTFYKKINTKLYLFHTILHTTNNFIELSSFIHRELIYATKRQKFIDRNTFKLHNRFIYLVNLNIFSFPQSSHLYIDAPHINIKRYTQNLPRNIQKKKKAYHKKILLKATP